MAVSKSIKILQKSNIINSKMIGNTKLSKLNQKLSYSDDIRNLFNWEKAVDDELYKK